MTPEKRWLLYPSLTGRRRMATSCITVRRTRSRQILSTGFPMQISLRLLRRSQFPKKSSGVRLHKGITPIKSFIHGFTRFLRSKIGRHDCTELISSRGGISKTIRLRRQCLLEEIAHHPAVTEGRRTGYVRIEHFLSHGLGDSCIQLVAFLFGKTSEDRRQLISGVIREVDESRKSRAKSGVRLDKGFHSVAITRSDHDEIFAIVFHQLEECLDCFTTEILVGTG